jgi:hypothetical protein
MIEYKHVNWVVHNNHNQTVFERVGVGFVELSIAHKHLVLI